MTLGRVAASGRKHSGVQGVYFDLDPNNAALVSVISGGVDAASYSGRVLRPANATRFAFDAVNTQNGRPCITLTKTGVPVLYTIVGGPKGDEPHSIVAVVNVPVTPTDLRCIAAWGRIDGGIFADGTAVANSLIGTASNAWWGGGNGAGAPTTTFTSGVTVVGIIHTAGSTSILVNGQVAATQALTRALPGGLGIGFWNGSFGAENARLYRALWFDRAITTAQFNTLVRELVAEYALPATPGETVWIGDSRTFGFTNDNPTTDSPPAQLATQLAALHPGITTVGINLGVSGNNTTQMLSLATSTGAPRFSPRCGRSSTDPGSVWVQMGFINDVTQGVPSSTIINNLIAMSDLRKSLGPEIKFIITTDPPQQDNPANATVSTVNTWIRTQAVSLGHADAIVDLSDTRYGDLSNASFHPTDATHFSSAGSIVIAKLVADGVAAFAA